MNNTNQPNSNINNTNGKIQKEDSQQSSSQLFQGDFTGQYFAPQIQKEREVLPGDHPSYELIKPSEPEPVIEKEVLETGVRSVNNDRPVLSEEVKSIGLTDAKESTPVSTQPSGLVQLKEELLKEGADKQNPGSSIRWLLTEAIKQLKKMAN
ncbi:MAG: hypothetical protein M1450_01005 [Patescibacteria group bacterium]|nr:hypothetical protein [Patescibacteria group bacterium]